MALRLLQGMGCEVWVSPAASNAAEILATGPDGVLFSSGPGDPATCDDAVDAMRGVLSAGGPPFGVCLGSQIEFDHACVHTSFVLAPCATTVQGFAAAAEGIEATLRGGLGLWPLQAYATRVRARTSIAPSHGSGGFK